MVKQDQSGGALEARVNALEQGYEKVTTRVDDHGTRIRGLEVEQARADESRAYIKDQLASIKGYQLKIGGGVILLLVGILARSMFAN